MCLAMSAVGMCIAVACMSAVAEGEKSKSVVYKKIGERELRMEIDFPPDWKPTDKRVAIVFWSGGAFKNGRTGQFRRQARYLADRGMVAFRAEYRDRTRDNADLRVCIEDAASAMRWVRKHASEYGVDPQRIVSSGGSAGGYLAAVLCSVPPDIRGADDDLSVSTQPNAMVLFNPALATPEGRRFTGEMGKIMQQLDEYSPVYNVPEKFPPTLILIGSEDSFLPLCRQFCEKGREKGARMELEVYEGQRHAFFNFAPWLGKTIERADRFLQDLGYLKPEPKVPVPSGPPMPPHRRK